MLTTGSFLSETGNKENILLNFKKSSFYTSNALGRQPERICQKQGLQEPRRT